MFDELTINVALAGVSLTVLVLFYVAAYRPTRSSFAGWWSLSLVGATLSSSLLLFNGSELQVIANPAATVIASLGVTCVWFALRSLRVLRPPLWLLAVIPVPILGLALAENPAENVWAGSGLLFFYMAVMFTAGSVDVWRVWLARRAIADRELNPEAVVAFLVLALTATALAVFYLLLTVLYVVVGPDSETYESSGAPGFETAIILISLVGVTFSVSAVSWDQQTRDLRRRAMEDDLTGLLARGEFCLRAERAFVEARTTGVVVLVVAADLDHFKAVNDVHGHAAGDSALVTFAAALRQSLRPGDFAGRMGGEEFGLVLLDVDDAEAFARLDAIGEAYATQSDSVGFTMPTASYGIAGLEDGNSLTDVLKRADLALYFAKAQGRNQAVRYSPDIERSAGSMLGRRQHDRDDIRHSDDPVS